VTLPGQTREELRLRVDQELRRRLKIKAERVKPRSKQCKGLNHLGGRCMNTAVDGDYCYAHRGNDASA
jgi:hypothetical protein